MKSNLGIAVLALATLPQAALPQAYPAKPIRIVNEFISGADFIATQLLNSGGFARDRTASAGDTPELGVK